MKVKLIWATGWWWLWVAILVWLADRYTKTWAIDHLIAYQPFRILPIFNLTLAFNTGAAFSFLHTASGWQHWLLGGLALIASIVMLVWLYQWSIRAWFPSIALCCILGGALGNLWDRIAYGHVIDFIDFHMGDWHWPIFNLADSSICVGAFMLICYWWRHRWD
jgi:signal peptidase II